MDKPVLLYDGVCKFCFAISRFIKRLDTDKKIDLIPIQLFEERKNVLYRTADPDFINSVVFIKNNQVFTKSQAIIQLLTCINKLPFVVLVLKILPSRLNDLAYNFIARNRFRIFGKNDVCKI